VHTRYAGKIGKAMVRTETGRVKDGSYLKEKARMARSEAEKRRIIEEADSQLALPWMTWGELDRLSPRQRSHEYQKFTQPVMTYLGRHKTCKLPACRRARACKGFISETQYQQGGYHDAFPPCLGKGTLPHDQALAAMDEIYGRAAAPDDTPKYAGRASDRAADTDETS